MPTITNAWSSSSAAGQKPPQPVPKSPEDRPIHGDNCCALCLYNIPRGSLMITLPGLAILLIGCIVMSLTETSDSWSDGTSQLAIMLVIIGGVLFLLGLIYWTVMWCKYRPRDPKRMKKPPRTSSRAVSPDAPVELVAVYHISNSRKEDPAYQVSGPGPSGVVQVS